MLRDVENTPLVNNPYNSSEGAIRSPSILDKAYRVIVLLGSIYMLHRWGVYGTVHHDPQILHEWFKVGLASSIGKY